MPPFKDTEVPGIAGLIDYSATGQDTMQNINDTVSSRKKKSKPDPHHKWKAKKAIRTWLRWQVMEPQSSLEATTTHSAAPDADGPNSVKAG